jgi:catechol-2,3-dioxygenase
MKTTRLKRHHEGSNKMKVKLTSLYVGDQDKAQRFYAEILALRRKPISIRTHFASSLS